jgi:hypothetical protein
MKGGKMVRENRIKEYRFTTTEITASAGEIISAVSNHVLNGTVQKVEILANNYTTNGSIYLFVSGTNELIWSRNGTATTSGAFYPHVFTVDQTNVTGSPYVITQRVINSPVYVGGSGLGAGTSGLGINIIYI